DSARSLGPPFLAGGLGIAEGTLGIASPPAVDMLRLSPRTMGDQPLVAAHVVSSEPTNSAQVRYREAGFFERAFLKTPSIAGPNDLLRRWGDIGSSATIL